jgi:hypothetical protein
MGQIVCYRHDESLPVEALFVCVIVSRYMILVTRFVVDDAELCTRSVRTPTSQLFSQNELSGTMPHTKI